LPILRLIATTYLTGLLHLLRLYQTHYPQPVGAIQQALADFDLDFVQRDLPKLLVSMQEGTNRIRDIVLSLRNFARLDEAGRKRVNLHEGLDSTILLLQQRLRPAPPQMPIQVQQQYGALPLVECYAGQLNQVFWHLLENAIDAILTGPAAAPGQITITTAAPTPDWVVITIADNGSGIAEPVRAKMFDPFFTTKPIGQGTGLGLAVSYQVVVEQHGGELTCTSVLGQGTQFTLRLPVRPVYALVTRP
jgi:signal transduction histidine kinase